MPRSTCKRRYGEEMAFLDLEALTKTFGTHAAVDGLSLTVEKGEFVSLLGPSGCGKTTTLQMIAGFVEPARGRDPARRPRPPGGEAGQARPGHRVPELRAVPAHDGGRERELRPRDAAACPRPSATSASADARAGATWPPSPAAYPRELSGGQRQRVALARALVIRPPVLLLDEPLSNLDAKLREEMQFELRHIQRKVGTTTIMVTHDQAEAMSISDRVVVMNRPREQIGRAAQAYEQPATLRRELRRQDQPSGGRHGAAGEDLVRADGPRRHGTHAHLPGQPLALPGRDAGRPGDRDPPEYRRGDAGRGRCGALAWGKA